MYVYIFQTEHAIILKDNKFKGLNPKIGLLFNYLFSLYILGRFIHTLEIHEINYNYENCHDNKYKIYNDEVYVH